mmetsp:Transcript_27159/g.76384  ORF Transcript_27159/g.76384 Transcript_27159/m.76384 type:complete len:328 (-) Transcript_27159:152-1135(-)|eukprot:CAMPEP_0119558242 /NCGR_PEP_ID=MMETSP1352-20130426/10421_1 /TAXON_ID=265584 /ORGANISM="Stauroneis constricta, Strain CCMP1120" /LENGTH=327 /DNA_ID=CAMNT_0007605537 /DNA_START=75 /DNA_END=1058 /DNA_ORIENTATION=+
MDSTGSLIVQVNNTAAAALEEGRCEDAIQLFTESLAVAKGFLDNRRSDSGACACSAARSRTANDRAMRGMSTAGTASAAASGEATETATASGSPSADPALSSAISPTSDNRQGDQSGQSGDNWPRPSSSHLSLDECVSDRSFSEDSRQLQQEFKVSPASPASFVYLCPMYFPDAASVRCTCRSNGAILAIVSIFNLALSHHIHAMGMAKEGGLREQSMEVFEKARRLYELAFQLYTDDSDEGAAVEGGLLFLLATVNNLGMIHQQLGRPEPAHKCFQHVLSTMVFLIDQQQLQPSPAQLKGMTKHLWQRFLDNTHHLVKKSCAAAAA